LIFTGHMELAMNNHLSVLVIIVMARFIPRFV